MTKTSKELVEWLECFISNKPLEGDEVEHLIYIQAMLGSRLKSGRPRKFATDQERWAYHNERRRQKKNELEDINGRFSGTGQDA